MPQFDDYQSQYVRLRSGEDPISDTNPLPVVGATGADAGQVQGNVAHDAADAGNPVKIGGIARTGIISTVAAGDRVDGSFDAYGNQRVIPAFHFNSFFDGVANGSMSGWGASSLSGDAADRIGQVVAPGMFNGTTWDRLRGNATDGLQTYSDAIGAVDDAAWDGSAGSATLIAIMKYCGAKLAEISTNTAP